MNYWIIASYYRGNEQGPLPNLYLTPYQADIGMRALAPSRSGFTYGVRPATWQEREERMFLAPEPGVPPVYEQPVWSEERFWKAFGPRLRDHYVHTSFASPDMIAFTEDDAKGVADRQTLMKPGKYLQKFLGDDGQGVIGHGPMKGLTPVVSKQQIAFYAAWHKAGKRPVSEDTLLFAETEDEMIDVYERGPDSCMSGTKFSGAAHPIRVYAAGDLRMAYMLSASNDVIARALCWPAKEVFGRVYPTPSGVEERGHYDEMMARLKGLGWQSIEENGRVFDGARLIYREVHGEVIMPYLDHSYGVEECYENGETFWRMSRSMHHQENTCGTYRNDPDDEDDESRWYCDCCDESQPEYDSQFTVYGRWRHQPTASNPRRGYGVDERTWCEGCADYNAFYCDGTSERYVDTADRIEAANGESYIADWFWAHGGWACQFNDDYWLAADDPPVILGNGEKVHEDALDGNAFQCFLTGTWWPIEDESGTVPGYHCDHNYEDQHPVEYECLIPEPPQDMEAWARAHAIPSLGPADAIVAAVYGLGLSEWPSATELLTIEDVGSIEGMPTPRSWAEVGNILSTHTLNV